MPVKKKNSLPAVNFLIREIRGQRVILDSDLARLYGVSTKRLNEQVRRNIRRFPGDFMFRLSRAEYANLKSQIATSSLGHGGKHKLPLVFTEQGAVMAANVLNSVSAVRMSVFVVRAFVQMRNMLLGHEELASKLVELEKKLTGRLDIHEVAITDVLRRIMLLLDPPPPPLEPPRRRIGFHVDP